MKIAVAGTGYVGLSLAVLLSQHNEVVALDIIKEKVKMINNKKITHIRQRNRRIPKNKKTKPNSNNRQTKSIPRCRIYNNSNTNRL